MEFSELFTQSARQVLPRARGKGLVSHFDYEGPDIELVSSDSGVRAGIHRLLLGITDCLDAGFLMFRADVEAPIEGKSRVVAHAAGTGDVSSELPNVLARLGLHSRSGADEGFGSTREAVAACQVTGGRVQFVDAGLDGLVLSLEMHLPAIRLQPASESPADAGGAGAWLVSQGLGRLDSVERRLRRLGWAVRSFESLDEATSTFLESGGESAALPMLLIVSEASGNELDPLERVATAHPGVCTVLAVAAGSASLRAREHTPVDVRILPLSPNELESFTARADFRTSTVESRQTSPVPLYTHEAKQVLVVDDSSVNQLLARAQLEVLGYEVAVAGDGDEALKACLALPPDLVLMDVEMPVMDGLAATQRIRAMQEVGALPPFPIVAATAQGASVEQDCLDSGMDGFLSKPMELQSLADEIHRVLPTRPVDAYTSHPPDDRVSDSGTSGSAR